MSAKDVKFAREAREGITRGVDILANAVRVTLGPKGRNVVIDKSYGAPRLLPPNLETESRRQISWQPKT